MRLTLMLSAADCALLFLCIWGVTVTLPTRLLAKNFPEDVQWLIESGKVKAPAVKSAVMEPVPARA